MRDLQRGGDSPPDDAIFLFEGERKGEGKYPLMQYRCPCGCGSWRVIHTQHSKKPLHWILTYKDGKVSLQDSVKHNTPNICRAHYFIKENKVIRAGGR